MGYHVYKKRMMKRYAILFVAFLFALSACAKEESEIIEKEHKPKKMSVSSEQKAFASVDRIKSCYRCEFEFSCLDAGRPCSRYSYVD